MKKPGRALVILGVVLLVGAAASFAFLRVLCIGLNDAEWSHIANTGRFSTPSEVDWGAWDKPDYEHRTPQAWGEATMPSEVRRGVARSIFMTFTIYEGRVPSDPADSRPWMVLGPDWGASHRPLIPATLLVGGLALIGVGGLQRNKANKSKMATPYSGLVENTNG